MARTLSVLQVPGVPCSVPGSQCSPGSSSGWKAPAYPPPAIQEHAHSLLPPQNPLPARPPPKKIGKLKICFPFLPPLALLRKINCAVYLFQNLLSVSLSNRSALTVLGF